MGNNRTFGVGRTVESPAEAPVEIRLTDGFCKAVGALRRRDLALELVHRPAIFLLESPRGVDRRRSVDHRWCPLDVANPMDRGSVWVFS
jgi:hypothetical protein